MIISHKYKYIFLKTNKTAGTSVEIALSGSCGEDDIITPITDEDEAKRTELGVRGPQNYFAPYREYGLRDYARLLLKGRKKPRYYNHIPAEEVRPLIGDEIWNNYYKFCIERNPWERVISLYYFKCRSDSGPTIDQFVNSDAPLVLKQRGIGLYSINGEIAVDKIIRFEKIAEDLEEVRQHLGMPEKLELPRAKGSFRKDKRTYREILNEQQRDRIAEIFKDEIEMLGYEF